MKGLLFSIAQTTSNKPEEKNGAAAAPLFQDQSTETGRGREAERVTLYDSRGRIKKYRDSWKNKKWALEE